MYTAESLNQLIADRIPESQALEYKEIQVLQTRDERAELLKDLTGMGNGGGGTILYGIVEDKQGHNAPKGLAPITDPGLQGQIENVVRAGVRPPLLYRIDKVILEAGYALEVSVEPSPLGPYMCTNYGDASFRYFARRGTSVDRMSEQEVRDRYALAQRAAEHRPRIWEEHGLPLTVGGAPQVCVSALPLEPLPELLDLRVVGPQAIQPPPALAAFIRECCEVADAFGAAVLWAQGFTGSNANTAFVRLHRDGAAGMSQQVPYPIHPTGVARIADAMLAYLGWLWESFDLRRPVELKLSVDNITGLSLQFGRPAPAVPIQPVGMEVRSANFDVELEPWDVRRPSSRHQVVQSLMDRLVQAHGHPRVVVPFSTGHLYGVGDSPLSIALHPEMAMIWSDLGHRQLATITPSGAIFSSRDNAQAVAYVEGGVIIDVAGDTLAVTELGTGAGYPADCLPTPRAHAELNEPTTRSTAVDVEGTPASPIPTGKWSSQRLETVLDNFPT